MLKLIVMRHAKAVHRDLGQDDHRRSLTDRGLRQSERMGQKLKDMNWRPELIISSDATRTRETYEGFLLGIGEAVPLVLCHNFYAIGTYEAIRDELFAIKDLQTIMVVGHNPGWSEAVEELSGEPCSLHTADAALLTHPAQSWADAITAPGAWKLVEIVSAGI